MKIYSATTAAGLLGISRQRVYQLVQEGKLKPLTDVSPWMFSEFEIERSMGRGDEGAKNRRTKTHL